MPAVDTGLHSPERPHTKVKIRVDIPEKVFEEYEAQASKVGMTVENLLAKRLVACVSHNAMNGIYLNDEQVTALQKASGRIIDSPEKAVSRLSELSAIMVGDVMLEIPLPWQRRIEARAKAFRQTYEVYLEREMKIALQKIAGLLPW